MKHTETLHPVKADLNSDVSDAEKKELDADWCGHLGVEVTPLRPAEVAGRCRFAVLNLVSRICILEYIAISRNLGYKLE